MSAIDIAPHAARFLAMLDARFREYGEPGGLPDRLARAVEASPRHRFVHRFRLNGDGRLHAFEAAPERYLPLVYSDHLMRHVDAEGAPLPSSNSQPSYVLWLLHTLGIEPVQSVLEIGSGSGWLAAIMGRLAGPQGRVTGIEIIADLARQSRADLVADGPGNVEIRIGDGTGPVAGGPFDRVMVTAATWDVTAAMFDAVAEGGRLLVPILMRGGSGCQVTLLRREGGALHAESSTLGLFVPLVGQGQPAGTEPAPARARLAEIGPPGPGTYTFSVMRAQDAPEPDAAVHVERRGDSALVRRLGPDGGSWKDLPGWESG